METCVTAEKAVHNNNAIDTYSVFSHRARALAS